MDFVAVGEAELAGAQHFAVAFDYEFGLPFEDQEDFGSQVVGVRDVFLARLHLEKTRTDVGMNDEVLDVGA